MGHEQNMTIFLIGKMVLTLSPQKGRSIVALVQKIKNVVPIKLLEKKI